MIVANIHDIRICICLSFQFCLCFRSVCWAVKIIGYLITIVKLINEQWARAFVFITTLVKRTGVISITLRVKYGSVADTLNLHMSSNSYIRTSLGMQIHTNSVLPHNNIDNESFTQQTLHTIRRWAPIQKGLRPDRPTQPETWRSPETLQESKKHKQSVISLQSPTEACCHRRGSQHVLRLCLCKSWPGRRSSQRTVQRISWNRLWFGLLTTCLSPIKGSKSQAVSHNGPS